MPAETLATSGGAHAVAAGKYLTFKLGRESYGVPVLKIREIIRRVEITSVPRMPEHVKGVINLRGKIIPVVDLHVKFGCEAAANTDRTCIVVVQVRGAAGGIHLGLLVDDVEEVAQIAAGDIEEAPEFGAEIRTDYILGMAKLKGRVAILLDIDQALQTDAAEFAGNSEAKAS